MIKKFLMYAVMFAVVFSCFSPFDSVKAESKSVKIVTPEEYIGYLEEQVELEENQSSNRIKTMANVRNESSAKFTLQKFKKLPRGQQKKFVKYLSDEKIIKAFFDSQLELKNGESVEILKGDVVFSAESGIETAPTKGISIMASGTYTVWHRFTAKMFGVPVFKTEAKGNYNYNSDGATRANWTDGQVLYNYNITTEIRKTSTDGPGKISNGRFTGTVYFSYRVFFSGYGPQIGVRYHKVHGDEDGVDGGSSGVY